VSSVFWCFGGKALVNLGKGGGGAVARRQRGGSVAVTDLVGGMRGSSLAH